MPTQLTSLTTEQAKERVVQYGPNIIPEKKQDSIITLFFLQFKSPLIYTLLVVALITLMLREFSDTVVIGVVLILNAVVGTYQEYRSNNTVKALKKLSRAKNNVLRDGEIKKIFSEEVTVDDIIFLDAGDIIPADGIIFECHSLKVNESQINGESLPMSKNTTDQNKVYKSTIVSSGSALMRVEHVGRETVIGQLAIEIENNINNKTPLEKKVDRLSLYILYTILATVLAVFVVGLYRGFSVLEIFKTAATLGVAAIPEGLPAVLTITLSIGAYRISKAKALLKNLPSGATLASVSYICTDKTGTLTHGDIEVKEIIHIHTEEMEDAAFAEIIYHSLDVKNINGRKIGDILDLKVDAYMNGSFSFTETKESPFTSENKYNAKEFLVNNEYVQIYKGAPELFLGDTESFAGHVKEGYRVLFVGYKKSATEVEFDVQNVTPVALIVFEDKIREGVRTSIANCKRTGIKVIMITGDNIDTARHVAHEVGILGNTSDICLLGSDLDAYSDEQLAADIAYIKVIGRASPMHKQRIIKILQNKKEVVAMTGDGVNDGPALAMADIGIAMGKSGTEVAKESSDLVLVNDDFSNIVLSIFEARTIFENIKKTIIYLISTAIGELIIVSFGVFAGLPVILIPVQILWLNLITDGFLDIAISTERAEENYKIQKYKRYQGFILDKYDELRIVVMAMTMAILCIIVFYKTINVYPLITVQTIMFCVMTIFQWFNALNVRKHYAPVYSFNIFSNTYINWAILIEIVLLTFGIYTELGNKLLKTVPLPMSTMMWLVLISASIVVTDTIYKLGYRRKKRS